MTRRIVKRASSAAGIATIVATLISAPLALTAQGSKGSDSFDRTKVPALGKTPTLKLPIVEKATLANGVGVQLVGQHEVPLVQITLVIDGGSRLEIGRAHV